MAGDRPFFIPLRGKLNTADKKIVVNKGFTSLINFAPAVDGLKPEKGMTKINSTALDSDHQHVQSCFHFRKDSPVAESHLLAQAVDTSDANPSIIDHTTAIPNTGLFGSHTKLLLNFEGADGATYFRDDSLSRHYVSVQGDAQLDTGVTPQTGMGSSSGLFDGDDNLAITNHSDFDFSSDQIFTIDFWVYPTSLAANEYIYWHSTDSNNRLSIYVDNVPTAVLSIKNAGNSDILTKAIAADEWSHVACVGDGTNYRLFVNGVGTSLTNNDNVQAYTGDVYIGAQNSIGGSGFVGNLDALRVTKGMALWTSDFDTALPTTTPTEIRRYTEDTAASLARFSDAPNGQVIVCDNKASLIWGGNEMKVAGVLTSTATIPNASGGLDTPRDFTGKMRNSSQDNDEVMIIGGGNDSFCVLMLHMDGVDDGTTFTDSSITTPHTVTAVGNAVTSVDQVKLGTAAGYFGTGDRLTIPDNADFDYSSDEIFTLDMWIYPTNASGNQYLWHQRNAGDTDKFIVIFDGNNSSLLFQCTDSGGTDSGTSTVIAINKWTHLAVVCDGSNFYWFIDGVLINSPSKTVTIVDYANTTTIGSGLGGGNDYQGYIDELRLSKGIARWTSGFNVPARAYTNGGLDFLVGSSRPLQGCKFYLKTVNGETATLSMKYWNGTSFYTANITDETQGLSVENSVYWPSTVSDAKPRYFEGRYIYWYNFTLTTGYAEIYQITLDAPMQKMVDVWDGDLRPVYGYFIFSNNGTADVYNDYTTNVALNQYDTGNDATLVTSSGTGTGLNTLLTASEYQVFGSLVRLSGLFVGIVGGEGNEATATLTISYWDGSAWVALTNLVDGTLDQGATFGKSGTITWQVPDESVEYKTEIAGRIPLYYYKIVASADLSVKDIQVYYMAGIAAQEKIPAYRFAMLADNCTWLGDEVDGDRNSMIRSAPFAPEIFNGRNSFKVRFGDEKKLMGAVAVSVNMEDEIQDLKVVYKTTQMFLMRGGPAQDSYRVKMLEPNIGLIAPETLRVGRIDVDGDTIQCSIWKGSKGIYVWYGGRPKPVHWDIRNFFDPDQDNHRKFHADYIDRSISFINEETRRYHIKFADGNSSGELNREFVMDMRNPGEWHEVYRTDVVAFTSGGYSGAALTIGNTITCNGQTAVILYIDITSGTWAGNDAAGDLYLIQKTGAFASGAITISGNDYATASGDSAVLNLQCACIAEDTVGNEYPYGFVDTGYMQRLEFGQTMDGKDIIYQFRTGAIALHKDDPMYETLIQFLNVLQTTKSTTTNEATIIHYGNGNQSGTVLEDTYDPTKPGYDFTGLGDDDIPGIQEGLYAFHSFEGVMATDDETVGWEPIALTGYYQKNREDKD